MKTIVKLVSLSKSAMVGRRCLNMCATCVSGK